MKHDGKIWGAFSFLPNLKCNIQNDLMPDKAIKWIGLPLFRSLTQDLAAL